MKVAVFGIEDFPLGKEDLPDQRLERLQEIFNSKKITPIQIEFIPIQDVKDAEVILTSEEKKLDLILSDLEYIQDRLTKEIATEEKELFLKAQQILEKEEFLSKQLSPQELKILKGFPLLSVLPVYIIKGESDIDLENILPEIYNMTGRIAFFTAGEKDARAWSILKGTNALDAAGCIHSDIKQGFIRAEVVSVNDIIKAGHYNQVKNEGKIRLENKDYIVQDGDYIIFRFNK